MDSQTKKTPQDKLPRETLPRSTTAAHVALSNSPALATSEARKNKKSRNSLASNPTTLEGNLLPAPIMATINIPAEAAPNQQMSNHSPNYSLPTDLMSEDSPTPPATPSRKSNHTMPTPQLISMLTPNTNMTHPLQPPISIPNHTTLINRQTIDTVMTPTPSNHTTEPRDNPLNNPPPQQMAPILDLVSTSNRLTDSSGRRNTPNSRFAPKNPLDKYTPGPFPPIYNAVKMQPIDGP